MPLVQASQIKIQVKLSSYPFSKGAMRYAFYMIDKSSGDNMVAKLPINVHPSHYNLQAM
jgi:hypothetical protein